jgi:hypothetical protein
VSRPAADVIEDLEFLDSTGVGAVDAAERTDFPSAHAMEKWLERHARFDLWLSLKRRDPAGTHLSGSDRKERRLMAAPTPQPDTFAKLIANGVASTRARTRKKAERAGALIDELRDLLNAECAEDERREKARKDVERLERQLAEAKALLRGGPVAIDVDGGVTAAELREWAKANGVECPDRGRVPAAVREAFDAAEEQAS